MESPKVINKVLLSSVAFGVSFGIGMLISKADIKNALTTGALAATAGFAGTLVSERKKADGENSVEDSLSTGVRELKIQEDRLHQSITEATMRMEEVEASINSLQTEHAQLVENISDLNSQKQQLETEYNNWQTQVKDVVQQQEQTNQTLSSLKTQKEVIETSIAAQQAELAQIRDRFTQAQQQQEELDAYLVRLENRKQELEAENQNLQAQIEELEQKQLQIAQELAPLGEEPVESEAFEEYPNEELEPAIDFASEESSEIFENELTVNEAESDNFVDEIEEVHLDNLGEEAVSEAEELTDGNSEKFDDFFAENPVVDEDYPFEEVVPVESTTEDVISSDELREENSQQEPIFLEQLDSIEQEEIDSSIALELTDEDSEQFDDCFAENSVVDENYSFEEVAPAESTTEDVISSDELMDEMEGIDFEMTEQSSWAELDNSEEENATIIFTPSESMTEESEDLDNLFDSESLDNPMNETKELGILDIVGELAQPESVESTIEESVTLEGLMNEVEVASFQEPQEVRGEQTKELDEDFFNSIAEVSDEESTDIEQKSEQSDFFVNSSYTSELNELETEKESELLENLINHTEENFLESWENVDKLTEIEVNEGSTVDSFLSENLNQEDSFEQWEATNEELSLLDDLSTSMTESSLQEELEMVDEKLSELDSISEASLEEFKDLLESMDEQNTSTSFSDDVDDIETTKTQNLWD